MKITRSQAQGQAAANLLATLKNPQPLLKRIGQTMVDSAVGRIVGVKQDPQGNEWAPWATSTLMARTRAGTVGGGLLYNSGRLASSIQYQIVGNQVSVMSTVPYGTYLQNGTPNMPARPFLGIGPGEQEAIYELMRNSFRGK